MKFTCPKAEFLSAVQTVSRAVPTSTTESTLLNILLSAEEETPRLTLTGTNNQISIRHSMPVELEKPGKVTILGSLLLDLATQMGTTSSDTLTFEVTDGPRCLVTSGDSAKYDVGAFSAENFPLSPKMLVAESIQIPVDVLKEMIKRTTVVTAGGGSGLQAYEEILIQTEGKSLCMVATDSVRLGIVEKSFEKGLPKVTALVPHSALSELAKVVKTTDPITMDVADDQVSFSWGSTELRARTSDKTFPNFRTILPKTQETWVTLRRRELLDNLKGVLPLAKDVKQKVFLDFNSTSLVLRTTSPELGDARRSIEVALDGEPKALAFNGKYLLDFLNTVDCELVKIGVSKPSYPALLLPEEEVASYKYVLMPITHY